MKQKEYTARYIEQDKNKILTLKRFMTTAKSAFCSKILNFSTFRMFVGSQKNEKCKIANKTDKLIRIRTFCSIDSFTILKKILLNQ